MNTNFNKLDISELSLQIFNVIGKQWFLLTAGNQSAYNTMTASWGTMGILWNKPVAIVFIRPQRHTFEFANTSDKLTLSVFPEAHRDVLNYCGKFSGKEVDKIKETGLSVIETPNGGVSYQESEMYIDCTKLFVSDMKEENFLVKELVQKHYAKDDFHRMYVLEINGIYSRAEQS